MEAALTSRYLGQYQKKVIDATLGKNTPVRLYHIVGGLYDVFFGSGWDLWSRVNVSRDGFAIENKRGSLCTDHQLAQLKVIINNTKGEKK